MRRLEKGSDARSLRTPYTTSAPFANSSSIADRAWMSSCPSQSIVTVASQPRARASIRPAHRACCWPRFRLCRIPRNRGSASAKCEIVRQVPSSLPSSTKRMRNVAGAENPVRHRVRIVPPARPRLHGVVFLFSLAVAAGEGVVKGSPPRPRACSGGRSPDRAAAGRRKPRSAAARDGAARRGNRRGTE